jgi:hypothetical protein
MIEHLSRAEFVDLIDSSSALPAERAQHAETCPQCREQADMLRAMRSLAAEDATPEPSPLFWDHFSARVTEELRREPVPVAPRRWVSVPLATWAAAATIVVLLISTALWRTTVHAPAPRVPEQASASSDLATVEPADDVDRDEAWAVVRAATADLAWEDAHEAGITPRPGEVENLALQLNAAERVELERLLDEDMKRNGA